MADFLQQMARASIERAERAEELLSFDALMRNVSHLTPPRKLKFEPGRFGVIAEIKRAAPSAGTLNAQVDVGTQARGYSAAGADAISVLTEPSQFLGRDEDLYEAVSAGPPVMRKDFLVSEYQVAQARALGADGVLLITAMLSDGRLRTMLTLARELGMFVLVEAFDERDIERSLAAGANLMGVNCRNLRDLKVEFSRFEKLRPRIPAGIPAIAESGITKREDALRVQQWGYHGALIGTALMRGGDPAQALRELRP